MSTRSFEERVNTTWRKLILINSAAVACISDEAQAETDDVLVAIAELALEAAADLEPLRHGPAEVLNWEPEASPDADATGGAR